MPDELFKERSGSDNRYYCEHCRTKRNATKQFTFLELPEVLVIHIKRFDFSGHWAAKKSDRIVFDETLDMSAYVSSAHQSSLYELRAVINHHGNFGGIHVQRMFYAPLFDPEVPVSFITLSIFWSYDIDVHLDGIFYDCEEYDHWGGGKF